MRLFSYVVARDFGFAPNPFFGVCTLATCKPEIRRVAGLGDWVAGTGSKTQGREGRLVFVMKVAETLSFEEYWADPRYLSKRPNLRGSEKQAYGDNIYRRDAETGEWLQENSHHSLPDGRPCAENIEHDTQTSRVLIGTEFVYWGGSGPLIPDRFRSPPKREICAVRGHRSIFEPGFENEFVNWLGSLGEHGYIAAPLEWTESARTTDS